MTSKSVGILDQVDGVIERAKAATNALPQPDAAQVQSHLVRYGCLLACAAIEQGLIDAAATYAGRIGDSRLENFVRETLKTGKNPSPEYIRDVTGKLDKSWADHIEKYIKDEVGEDKIKSIVSNRNRIAHGESVSMGVTSLMQWTPAARKLCQELERLTASSHANRDSSRTQRRRKQKRSS